MQNLVGRKSYQRIMKTKKKKHLEKNSSISLENENKKSSITHRYICRSRTKTGNGYLIVEPVFFTISTRGNFIVPSCVQELMNRIRMTHTQPINIELSLT